MLSLDKVKFAYRKKEVLRGVSLTTREGEIVVITGNNGAGKSTLLKIISGILPVHSGTLRLGSTDITACSLDRRHALGIGMLLQGGRVFSDLTVAENIELARNYAQQHVRGCVQPLCMPELAPYLGKTAMTLSGGFKQLLALEIVLCQQPTVLLLDEPTAALTHNLASTVFERVRDYAKRRSACAIIVEQNVAAAMAHADTAIAVVDGQLQHESKL